MFDRTSVERVISLENNITSMRDMFAGTRSTSLDLSNFNTSKVFNMREMFKGASVAMLDLSSWDTSNVQSMYGMFENSKLTSIDISSFDTSKMVEYSASYNTFRGTPLKGTFYARTQKDADKFNGSLAKPIELRFTVKP